MERILKRRLNKLVFLVAFKLIFPASLVSMGKIQKNSAWFRGS